MGRNSPGGRSNYRHHYLSDSRNNKKKRNARSLTTVLFLMLAAASTLTLSMNFAAWLWIAETATTTSTTTINIDNFHYYANPFASSAQMAHRKKNFSASIKASSDPLPSQTAAETHRMVIPHAPRVVFWEEGFQGDDNDIAQLNRQALSLRRSSLLGPIAHENTDTAAVVGNKENNNAEDLNAAAAINTATESKNLEEGDEEEEKKNGDECVPLAEWQDLSFPNCNVLHEIDLRAVTDSFIDDNENTEQKEKLSLLGEGWFRDTWRLDRRLRAAKSHGDDNNSDNNNDEKESVVLKTLRIEREFLEEYYDLHRKDALAMERLTSSAFVVNAYGYCGQSAINEMADLFQAPSLKNFLSQLRRMRFAQDSEVILRTKLNVGASIATGLANIHQFPADLDGKLQGGRPIIVHYDLNPGNVAMFKGPRPKLNDFNIAEFLRYNPKTNRTCGFPSRMRDPWWRSPEEVELKINGTSRMLDEKVDVFALGNTLYNIFTGHTPYGRFTRDEKRVEEIREKLLQGIAPVVPKTFTNDWSNPAVKAFIRAMDLCFRRDPADRGTAQEVAVILFNALDELKSYRQSSPSDDEEGDYEYDEEEEA